MTRGRVLWLAATVMAVGGAVALVVLGTQTVVAAILLLLGYIAIVLAGVFNPRLGMFAPVVARLPGQRREVALTFDDGPDPTTTPAVLALLARFRARATFFVLGEKVLAAPEVVRAIAQAGHTIGIHGHSHDRWLALRSPQRIAAEIERCQAAVAQITGQTPRLFRPPMGHVSPRTAVVAQRLGLLLVAWSVRSRDGLARTRPAEVERRVIRDLRPGAIVLLHDAAEHGDRTPAGVTGLCAILEHATRANLECVALSGSSRGL